MHHFHPNYRHTVVFEALENVTTAEVHEFVAFSQIEDTG